ncbi:MAG: ABC transporter substrate binding protein, partial [Prevotella sp.]
AYSTWQGLYAVDGPNNAELHNAQYLTPIAEQIDPLLKLYPNAKTIGTIYSSSEVNSEIQVKAMKEYAESKGLNIHQKVGF